MLFKRLVKTESIRGVAIMVVV